MGNKKEDKKKTKESEVKRETPKRKQRRKIDKERCDRFLKPFACFSLYHCCAV